MTDLYQHSFASMGTVVSLRVIGHAESPTARADRDAAVSRAAEWFRKVEAVCSRFDNMSELRRLSTQICAPVQVSPLLSRSIHFALALADLTEGAFDPTVGRLMEARGFDRSYLTGETISSGVPLDEGATYRDVEVDLEAGTVTLHRPLLLDLGAVAKGLAVDLATRELAPLENFAIDAGGDLYLSGHDEKGERWQVGIRHPRDPSSVFEGIRVTNTAICTSGDYERKGADGMHHFIDPRRNEDAVLPASVTVIAPSAMVADGLGTAAMVLGHLRGLALIESQGVEGLIITSDLHSFATPGFTGLTRASTPTKAVHLTSVA